jgi:beta-glucosidase
MVLLKNEGNTLPLKKDIKTLAVIGPNADTLEVLLGNYNGQPSKYTTPLTGIKSKVSASTKVLFSPGTYKIGVSAMPVPSSMLTVSGKGSANGLKGEYFGNRELKGDIALTRTDEMINFDWGVFSPTPQVPAQDFSVRWTGKLTPTESGKYQFGIAGNGGFQLFIDGQMFVDSSVAANRRTKTVMKDINLEAGHTYDVRMEYSEGANPYGAARLIWAPPSADKTLRDDAVATAKQSDAVVMFLGISPLVEGEEMEVKLEGFRGGDRTDIGLPKNQEELLRQVQATGKPIIVVLLNGSALAVNYANENVPAILESWYPGEEGGTAVADVLFGDYNPGGRLPVTFYKSVDQLPPFTDYGMQGRTYRYFKGEPLYPFGFGLSYTKFKYDNLKMNAKSIKIGEPMQVTVDVQNAGDKAGEEVVQLYITDVAASVPVPIRALAGIKRVTLRPGEKQSVSFTIAPRQMSVIDNNGKRVIEPGEFMVSLGGKQPGFSGRADAQTTSVVTGKFSATGKVTEIAEK